MFPWSHTARTPVKHHFVFWMFPPSGGKLSVFRTNPLGRARSGDPPAQRRPLTWWKRGLCVTGTPSPPEHMPSTMSSGASLLWHRHWPPSSLLTASLLKTILREAGRAR